MLLAAVLLEARRTAVVVLAHARPRGLVLVFFVPPARCFVLGLVVVVAKFHTDVLGATGFEPYLAGKLSRTNTPRPRIPPAWSEPVAIVCLSARL